MAAVAAARARRYESCPSQREYHSPEQTLIIYDWDDTLCPSCWIQENQPMLSFFRPPPRDATFLDPLSRLETMVKLTLQQSMQLGQVVIVTNAQSPWVETSCRNYMPGALPLIRAIPVVYAQAVHDETGYGDEAAQAEAGGPGMYNQARRRPTSNTARTSQVSAQTESPVNAASSWGASFETGTFTVEELAPQRWKEAAFLEQMKKFYGRYEGQSWKNVISVGDACFERDALRVVMSMRPTKSKQCRTKTVKLLDEPTIEELIKQVKVVLDGIVHIAKYDGNLDIELDEEDIGFDMDVIDEIIRG